MTDRITINKERLSEFCRQNHIVRLAFFGSVLRNDFGPNSDVDVLVWFEPDSHVTLFDMADMEVELTSIIGYKVDLRTPEDLSKLFRDEVVNEAEVQYVA